MKLFLLIPPAYLLIGIFYGWYHLKSVMKTLHKEHGTDVYLREMISMHNFTPTGAEYYVQLQNLHFEKGWILSEWELFEKEKTKYQIQTYLLGCLNWIYYVFHVKK